MDDVIYLTASDGIYALKADDGSVKWHFQMQQAGISAVQDSTVYAIAADQRVYALNASDGSERWTFQPAYPAMVQQIADGTVYLLASPEGPNGSGPNSILYALNASTGARRWQYPGGNDLENVQWIGAANGVAYLFTSVNEQFHLPRLVLAFNASTGAVQWRYQLSSQTASIQTAMLDNGQMYLENSDGTLDALGASDGAVRWQTQVGNIAPFIDLIDNGVIYTALASGSITAVIASNGSILWHYQPETTVEVLKASSGLLYLYTPPFGGPEVSNQVYALKISDGTLFWRYNVGTTPFFAVLA
jgi:outer membrane protein assembly factor BamB